MHRDTQDSQSFAVFRNLEFGWSVKALWYPLGLQSCACKCRVSPYPRNLPAITAVVILMRTLHRTGSTLAFYFLLVSPNAPEDFDDLSPLEEQAFREAYGEHPSVAPGDSPWVEMLERVLDEDPFDLRARSEAVRHERKLALHPERLFEAACSLLVYWQASGLPEVSKSKDATDAATMGAEALSHAIPRLLQDDEQLQRMGVRPEPAEIQEYAELIGELPVPPGSEREFLVRFNRMPHKRRAFLYPLLFQGQSLADRAAATGNTIEAVQKKFMKHFKPLLEGLPKGPGEMS